MNHGLLQAFKIMIFFRRSMATDNRARATMNLPQIIRILSGSAKNAAIPRRTTPHGYLAPSL